MTEHQKRCPFRYYNHLVSNTSAMWDNRCKLEEGHEGEHIEAGMIIPSFTQTQTIFKSGWIKDERQ